MHRFAQLPDRSFTLESANLTGRRGIAERRDVLNHRRSRQGDELARLCVPIELGQLGRELLEAIRVGRVLLQVLRVATREEVLLPPAALQELAVHRRREVSDPVLTSDLFGQLAHRLEALIGERSEEGDEGHERTKREIELGSNRPFR